MAPPLTGFRRRTVYQVSRGHMPLADVAAPARRLARVPGSAITALHIADPPERWSALGFAVAPDGTCQVGEVTLRLGCDGDGGIVGWTLSGSGAGEIDGVRTDRGGPSSSQPATVHPNTAVAVDHVVMATPDLARTLAALAQAGMALRRERDAGSSRRPLRQAFFRHGQAILEVVGPPQPDGEGPARLWGVTIVVDDLDAPARLLGDRIGPAHAAVQDGRRIATVRQSAGLSVPLALMTPAA
jgi:nucleotide-binding universal stress UspA family protein